ncbi:unnamed protein product [Caenorhabditis auriculariae]|uniref:protein-histidine N-methyltransferase n=1 Tax=Caenorhabditis auriculariae TaxID=2777116 RepID=A0A8S1H5B3_9PELO|nr:unnamed protein product [Caenorhabditis auriculariae]
MTQTSDSRKKIEQEETVIRQVGVLFEQVLSRPPPNNVVELWKEHLAIREKLDKIAELQSQLSDTNVLLSKPRSPESIEKLLKWADHMGIVRKNVEIKESDDFGLELRASAEIKKDDAVIQVPRNAILSLDLARKTAMLKKAFEKDPIVRGMGNVGLALFLCGQFLNGENSKWSTYISVLPTTLTTPLFYDRDQLLQLKPSPLFEEALMFYRTITRQFSYFLVSVAKNRVFENVRKTKTEHANMDPPVLYNTPFTVSNFTLNLYLWAVGIVTTRVNMIPSESETTEKNERIMVPALIPVFDMANHDFDALASDDAVCFSVEDDLAMLVSAKDVKKGDSVSMFYGRRSNGDHLLHNGFVPRGENPSDYYKLKIGIPKTDKALNAKQALISAFAPSNWMQSNIFHFDLINNPEHPFPEELEKFAQVFTLDDPNAKFELTTEQRKKALEFLKTRFSLLESSYGKEELSVDLPGIPGDIARLKASEREILRNSRIYCENLLSKLS